jgi:hypothetical protein
MPGKASDDTVSTGHLTKGQRESWVINKNQSFPSFFAQSERKTRERHPTEQG